MMAGVIDYMVTGGRNAHAATNPPRKINKADADRAPTNRLRVDILPQGVVSDIRQCWYMEKVAPLGISPMFMWA